MTFGGVLPRVAVQLCCPFSCVSLPLSPSLFFLPLKELGTYDVASYLRNT